MNHLNKREVRLALLTFAILAIGILFYILARLGHPVPCLFRRITGFNCPGCGNTRVVFALLRFDIAGAFSYNLLFPVEFLYLGFVYIQCAIAYLKTGKLSYHSPTPVLDVTVLVILFIWWVLRNILGI